MYKQIKVAPARSKDGPEATAVFLFTGASRIPAGYEKLPEPHKRALRWMLSSGSYTGKSGSVQTLYPEGDKRLLFVGGLGERERFVSNALRAAVAAMVRSAHQAKIKTLRLAVEGMVDGLLDADDAGMAVGDGLGIGGFAFDMFKGKASGDADKDAPKQLQVQVERSLRRSVDDALLVSMGVSTTRLLAAIPPNVANPAGVATHCRKVARDVGLRCTVIDAAQAKKLGMGGLLAVGRAGSKPPCVIVLEHDGASSKSSRKSPDAPILLIGKAITFDTGGYSLKPGGGRDMKYDKCGGMAVVGAMEAIARLKLRQRVVGLVPCAENMIDHSAYRPDDILKLANGVTVEVTNTDAEGRLILADALAYGTKQYKPKAVIDLATLTGGVITALGNYCAGVFCNDEKLLDRLVRAAERTGERLWRLPLWLDHREQMRSNHADLVNSSAIKGAHPIQGAAFLSFFVGAEAPQKMPTLPWAHVDIAGVVSREDDGPLFPKGPTGYGVRLLVETIRRWTSHC